MSHSKLEKKPNDFDLINNLGYAYLLNAEINKSIKFGIFHHVEGFRIDDELYKLFP